MDLRDYLHILRRNWILIAAASMAGILLGGAASILIRPTYTAETQLFVAIQNSGSAQELQQGNMFSQARVQSYVKTVATPIVLKPVIDTLGLETSVNDLAQRVKATSDLNTVLINISVADSSPVQASAVAQAVADSLIKAVDTLEKPKTGGTSPISLSIITPAEAPSAPSAPNTKLNILLGLLVGLILGVASALLRSNMDNRIRGEADLRKVTSAPLTWRYRIRPVRNGSSAANAGRSAKSSGGIIPSASHKSAICKRHGTCKYRTHDLFVAWRGQKHDGHQSGHCACPSGTVCLSHRCGFAPSHGQ